jgi:hypothetical protein
MNFARNIFWSITGMQYVCLLLLVTNSLILTDPHIDGYYGHYIILIMAVCNILSIVGILLNFVLNFLSKQQRNSAIISTAFITIGNARLMHLHLIITYYNIFPPV